MRQLHFKFFKYIFERSYPFNHWLILLISFSKLWIYSFVYSSIFSFIFQIPFIGFLKFCFVFNFFFMIYIVFSSYNLKDLFRLIYDTVNEIFRITIGRLFGLKSINYEYEQIQPRKHFGKNIFDFDDERSKVFQKKYEHIDFLVLNDYITIEEGNKKTDELLKKEYGYGFLVTLGGHYY